MRQTFMHGVVITAAFGLGCSAAAAADVVHIHVPTVRVAPVHVITQVPTGSVGTTSPVTGTHEVTKGTTETKLTHEVTKVGLTFQKIETSGTNGHSPPDDSWNVSTGGNSGGKNSDNDHGSVTGRFHASILSKWARCRAC